MTCTREFRESAAQPHQSSTCSSTCNSTCTSTCTSTTARTSPGAWAGHRRTFPHGLILLFALALFGCGPGDDAQAADATDSAGGEDTVREVPTGPTRSYLNEDDGVVMRLVMTRVRTSTLSADIGSLVRSYPTWQELLGRSGIDPVRDFDQVLVTAPESINRGGTMLVGHHLGNAAIREAVLTMSVERGSRPEWRQIDGFDVVDWPAPTDPPRLVVLTGEHELVVTTAEQLDRVIAVAHDHRLRRVADEMIEPAMLELEEGVIATIVADSLGDQARARIAHPPDSFEVVLRDHADGGGRMVLALRGNYADAAAAETARTWVVEQRDFYAGQMLVRAVGLDRPLREAVIAADGEHLTIDASFTEEEVQRVLGLLAFAQIGG